VCSILACADDVFAAAGIQSSATSAFKCEVQSACDLCRRSILFKGAAGLVPPVLSGGSASTARDYGSADCRGYAAGCPLPDADAQKLWSTRLGKFSKENDGYDNVRSSIVELIAPPPPPVSNAQWKQLLRDRRRSGLAVR
jgi:hypothetical protein